MHPRETNDWVFTMRSAVTSTSYREQSLVIPVQDGELHAELCVPAEAKGLVIFAHGSGSSRHSPRNKYVAGVLQQCSLGTLLADLLKRDEEVVDSATGEFRFNIRLLADRLNQISAWVRGNQGTAILPIGYFGASTGSAAALIAAAENPDNAGAVVSRGGRPDLATSYLSRVRAPTLLIVGGADAAVIDMNKEAQAQMRSSPTRMEIIRGATHLFEEPGALEKVAELASAWFQQYLKNQNERR
jgi:dienelactone hydrolase